MPAGAETKPGAEPGMAPMEGPHEAGGADTTIACFTITIVIVIVIISIIIIIAIITTVRILHYHIVYSMCIYIYIYSPSSAPAGRVEGMQA